MPFPEVIHRNEERNILNYGPTIAKSYKLAPKNIINVILKKHPGIKEINGNKLAIEKNIPAPRLLFSSISYSKKTITLLFEKITNGHCIWDKISNQSLTRKHIMDVLDTFKKCTEKTFFHGDVNCGNIFIKDDKVLFIDFEICTTIECDKSTAFCLMAANFWDESLKETISYSDFRGIIEKTVLKEMNGDVSDLFIFDFFSTIRPSREIRKSRISFVNGKTNKSELITTIKKFLETSPRKREFHFHTPIKKNIKD